MSCEIDVILFDFVLGYYWYWFSEKNFSKYSHCRWTVNFLTFSFLLFSNMVLCPPAGVFVGGGEGCGGGGKSLN